MRKMYLMALAVCLMTACEKMEIPSSTDATATTEPTTATKKFTFTLKGDFSDEWKTRGYLQADGKDLTDVWVLDYKDGTLVQQIHQDDNTAEDFGQPVMNLSYGAHHIYFIASRGTTPALNTENHIISFSKVLDTFYKDYEVSVVATSNGNRAVTLDRVVTRLRLTFSDAMAEDAATINVTPTTWYYGWDYINGTPAAAAPSQATTINIPSYEIGKTGVFASLYGFSSATEWTTNVSINVKTSTNAVLGSVTLTDTPFKANRSSNFEGPIFSSGGALAMALSAAWEDAFEGTW